MALSYKVIVSTTEPTETEKGLFWINPGTGEMFVMVGDWTTITGTAPFSDTEGTFNRTLVKSETEPTGTTGLLWEKPSVHEIFVYLNGWIPYISG